MQNWKALEVNAGIWSTLKVTRPNAALFSKFDSCGFTDLNKCCRISKFSSLTSSNLLIFDKDFTKIIEGSTCIAKDADDQVMDTDHYE